MTDVDGEIACGHRQWDSIDGIPLVNLKAKRERQLKEEIIHNKASTFVRKSHLARYVDLSTRRELTFTTDFLTTCEPHVRHSNATFRGRSRSAYPTPTFSVK